MPKTGKEKINGMNPLSKAPGLNVGLERVGFLLPDFQKLTEFLNDLSSSDGPVTTPLPS